MFRIPAAHPFATWTFLCLAACMPSWAGDAFLFGNYTLARDARSDIDAAIESSVARMNPLIRGMARKRLRQNNVAYDHIRIAHVGPDFELVFDRSAPLLLPADGTAVEVQTDGESSRISAVQRGTQLIQTYDSGNGLRVNTFRQETNDDLLYLDVETSSKHLPQPVRYTLIYRRTN